LSIDTHECAGIGNPPSGLVIRFPKSFFHLVGGAVVAVVLQVDPARRWLGPG
jgi:hypothetical protein